MSETCSAASAAVPQVPVPNPVPRLDLDLEGVLDLVPPKELAVCFGGGDFLAIGRALVDRMVAWAGLKPGTRFLDIGCGAGRAALPLTSWLGPDGSYEGFDVYPFGVDWCAEHVTPRFPNFRFRTVEVRNNLYMPFAQVSAGEFEFPFADNAFDFALANSVFTHMLPDGLARYLAELGRVLDQGAAAYLTFFLMDQESLDGLSGQEGRSVPRHKIGPFWVADREDLEEAVGYGPGLVENLIRKAGLAVDAVRPGHWRGPRDRPNYQDVVIVRKI